MNPLPIIINVMNYIGIIAFATSGALKAAEKDLDILGAVVLGSSVALAGGIIRDVLVGVTPPVNITYLPYPITAITASLVAYVLYPFIVRVRDSLMYADAVGLGTFAAIGAEVAFEHHLNVLGIVLMSAVTAAGGGVVRDILAGEIPTIFKRDIYATVAVMGGVVYVLTEPVLGNEAAVLTSALLTVLVRVVIILKNWDRAHITLRVGRAVALMNRKREGR
ncbi:trimeric intracellular cation channel family protein [Vulcanisaeta thermophila]|uniref:trimeric intracellular cation channel family protein n=1 Tax=Vulcanisaeta thermophila TaxID=867917 RepID=UPI000AD24DFF|nr:trimeric intracellular cation channel family protein [Vulcanisaeta thermophila]